MSINELFSPNDFSIYAGSLNVDSQTIDGNLIVNGNETITGDLTLTTGDVTAVGFIATARVELPNLSTIELGTVPNNWGIYKNTGANENLVIYSQGTAAGNSIILQTGTGQLDILNAQINGSLRDHLTNQGVAGQVLKSTGTQIEWSSLSSFIALQSVTPVLTNEFIGSFGHGAVYFPHSYIAPFNLLLRDVIINTSFAPGVGNNYTFTLYVNGVATGNTAVIADANTSVTVGFDVALVLGDTVGFHLTINGAAADPICLISFTYSI